MSTLRGQASAAAQDQAQDLQRYVVGCGFQLGIHRWVVVVVL